MAFIFSLYEKQKYSKLKSLNKFKKYCFINELFKELFINFQFQNLKRLNFNMHKSENNKRIRKRLNIDYNNINSFIINILLFKYKFSFQSFFNTYK